MGSEMCIRDRLDKGLGIYSYNRPGSRPGGGVSIIYDPRKIKLEENKFPRRGYEIVSAYGKLIGLNRNVVF